MVRVVLPWHVTATNVLSAFQRVMRFDAELPAEVCIDFGGVGFSRPEGITLLHNITKHLLRSGRKVSFSGLTERSDGKVFLDDCGFFEEHLGEYQFEDAALRSTTCKLIEVAHADSRAWIDYTFAPWLSRSANIPNGNLAEIRTCIMELFNNIQDHTHLDVGSIFAQWYPNKRSVEICLADFGPGIPETVRRVQRDLEPVEAIERAFEDGFSSKSTPRNRGAGLYVLKQNVVDDLGGSIYVMSGGVAANCDAEANDGNFTAIDVGFSTAGYLGTLINIKLPTDRIDRTEQEAEDDIW